MGYYIMTFEFPPQMSDRKGGWEPCFALKLGLIFRVLIQPYSSRLLNRFCGGWWAWLSVSESERQRTSKKDEVWFYVLFGTFLAALVQPRFPLQWNPFKRFSENGTSLNCDCQLHTEHQHEITTSNTGRIFGQVHIIFHLLSATPSGKNQRVPDSVFKVTRIIE